MVTEIPIGCKHKWEDAIDYLEMYFVNKREIRDLNRLIEERPGLAKELEVARTKLAKSTVEIEEGLHDKLFNALTCKLE